MHYYSIEAFIFLKRKKDKNSKRNDLICSEINYIIGVKRRIPFNWISPHLHKDRFHLAIDLWLVSWDQKQFFLLLQILFSEQTNGKFTWAQNLLDEVNVFLDAKVAIAQQPWFSFPLLFLCDLSSLIFLQCFSCLVKPFIQVKKWNKKRLGNWWKKFRIIF